MAFADTREGRWLARLFSADAFTVSVARLREAMAAEAGPSEPVDPADGEGSDLD